jgi:hypothetical protein
LINSDPLSESNPKIEKGSRPSIFFIPAKTHTWALFFRAIISSQPVQISVKLRLWLKSPLSAPPSWETRSTSKKPGLASSQSVKVLIGILFFSKVPGLVVDLPFILYRFLISANILSIVAALILKSFFLTLTFSLISPHFSNTGMISFKKGASLLE